MKEAFFSMLAELRRASKAGLNALAMFTAAIVLMSLFAWGLVWVVWSLYTALPWPKHW